MKKEDSQTKVTYLEDAAINAIIPAIISLIAFIILLFFYGDYKELSSFKKLLIIVLHCVIIYLIYLSVKKKVKKFAIIGLTLGIAWNCACLFFLFSFLQKQSEVDTKTFAEEAVAIGALAFTQVKMLVDIFKSKVD